MHLNQLLSTILVTLVAATTAIPMIMNENEQITQIKLLADKTTTPPIRAPTSIERPSQDTIREMQRKLLNTPTWQGRQKILIPEAPDMKNMLYQFVNNSVKYPTGGTIALAGVDQFPALTGIDLSFAVSFINPCGLNVPHAHPRANEFLVVHQGELEAGFVLEQNPNGQGSFADDGKFPDGPRGPIQMVKAKLTNYKGMLVPKGLTHFQFNPTCEPAVFTAAFDSSDPGRMQIAQTFFSILPPDFPLTATGGDIEILGPHNLERLRNKVPNSFVLLVDSCMKKCGFGGPKGCEKNELGGISAECNI